MCKTGFIVMNTGELNSNIDLDVNIDDLFIVTPSSLVLNFGSDGGVKS